MYADDRRIIGHLELLRHNLIKLQLRLIVLVSAVVHDAVLLYRGRGAQVASLPGQPKIFFKVAIDFPTHELLGCLLQITHENLSQMQVVVCLSPADLELLHVVIHNLLIELRRELQPVGVDATKPLQPFPDGNGHILRLKFVIVEDDQTRVFIYVDR